MLPCVVQKPPAFNIDFAACCGSPITWFVMFGGGWAFLAFLGNRAQKRRKMQYLPPELAVEGTGVKRGLTAVEAAILLEAPLNKVMTMILFGLLKKGIITVESEKPLKITATDPVPEDVKLRVGTTTSVLVMTGTSDSKSEKPAVAAPKALQ